MKTNTSGLVFNWFNSLLFAIAIVMLAAITTAKAQAYFDVINGLFTPTQSDRFFQAGREDFEREIELFTHPERYRSNDLLQWQSCFTRVDASLLSSSHGSYCYFIGSA